jgi:hypothetical protein
MLKDPNRTITNIADAAAVSRKMETKIKRQHAAQISGSFFVSAWFKLLPKSWLRYVGMLRTILLQPPPRFETTHPSR